MFLFCYFKCLFTNVYWLCFSCDSHTVPALLKLSEVDALLKSTLTVGGQHYSFRFHTHTFLFQTLNHMLSSHFPSSYSAVFHWSIAEETEQQPQQNQNEMLHILCFGHKGVTQLELELLAFPTLFNCHSCPALLGSLSHPQLNAVSWHQSRGDCCFNMYTV